MLNSGGVFFQHREKAIYDITVEIRFPHSTDIFDLALRLKASGWLDAEEKAYAEARHRYPQCRSLVITDFERVDSVKLTDRQKVKRAVEKFYNER